MFRQRGMIQIQEILELSVAERILMIEKIWNSIDKTDIALPAAHEPELDRRLKRYENGKTTFVTWGDIKNELNAAK
jgi:putative addiction module component (TIGR02574 family)